MSDPTPEPAPESPSSTVGDDTLIEGSEGVDLVARLCEATSLSKAEAQQYIEITGTLEGAMELYLDTQGRSGGGAAATAETDADASAHRSVSGSAAAAAAARPQKRSKVGDSDEDEGDESDPERVASDESEAFRTVSGMSQASGVSFGSASDFDDDDAATSESTFHDVVIAATMEANMEVYDQGFAVDMRPRGMDTHGIVQLNTGSLNQAVALAWDIDQSTTINLSIVIDYPVMKTSGKASELDMATVKVVEVEQPGAKAKLKVANQLMRIATNFCVAGGYETPELELNYREWAGKFKAHAKSKNFLTRMISYLHFRLGRLHMHCTICDMHQQDALAMLMPSVCTRTLCMYSWQTFAKLRLGDPSGGGRSHLVSLLRTFFVVAAASQRHELVLNPWPLVYRADGSTLLDKKTPISGIREISEKKMCEHPKVPCDECEKSREAPGDGLADPACPLCGIESWIVSSNRSMVVHIPETYQNELLCTSKQFLLLSNPPELESKFQEHKAKHGSHFFFHGSPTDNWHNIMRNGFFVASGEKQHMRLHGAAHGDGVYVAPQLQSSFGYVRLFGGSRGGSNANKVEKHFQIICVAICEVANAPTVKDCGWCKVIPEAELIVPRFLMVWDGTEGSLPQKAGSAVSTEAKFDEWCRERMKYNGCGPSVEGPVDEGAPAK